MANNADNDALPHQMEIYFAEFPTIDFQALAQFVESCDPGVTCAIGTIDDEEKDGMRVGGFTVSLGGMTVAALVHNVATRGLETIKHAAMTRAARDEILAHKAYALLTLVGGDDLAPVEKPLFMYKVSAALCLQGALGIGNIHTGRVLPGGALRDLFGKPLESGESVWDILRHHGEPPQLLMSVGRWELAGKRYLATCGFGYCGLPDLVWEYTNDKDAADVSQMFENCFTYMMENGPVIEAGHTVGYDEDMAFRFDEPPADLALPYPVADVLKMTKVGAQER